MRQASVKIANQRQQHNSNNHSNPEHTTSECSLRRHFIEIPFDMRERAGIQFVLSVFGNDTF